MPDPIAVAYIELRPDASKFQAHVEQQLKSSAQALTIPLKADTKALEQSVQKLGQEGGAAAAKQSLLQRVMGDVGAVTDRVTGIFGKGVEKFKEHGEKATEASEKTKTFAENLTKLGEAGTKVASGQGSIAGFLGSLGGGIPVIGGVIAGLGILGGFLEHIVQETAHYSFEIEEQNKLLGINTDTLQTLDVMVSRVGLDHDSLNRVLQRLQINVQAGGQVLNKLHMSLADVGITTTDLNVALPELTKWMSEQADVGLRNSVAQALLGRSASDVIAVFSKGPQAIQAQTEALKRQGLILDEAQLKAGAVTKVLRDQMLGALQGLERAVAGPLEAGFAQLFAAVETGAENSGGAMSSLGKTINDALSSVVSFFTTLIGGASGVDAVNRSLHTFNEKQKEGMQLSAKKAQDDAQEIANRADLKYRIDLQTASNDALTKSLDAQTRAAQDAQTAFDRNIDTQIQGQRDIVSVLDQRMQMEDLLQKQQDDAGTSQLAILQRQLQATKETYSNQRNVGESMVDFQLRIKEQDLQKSIDAEQQKRNLAKDTADIHKAQVSAETQKVIDDLTARRKAYDDDTAARLKSFADQRTASQSLLSDLQKQFSDTTAADKKALEDANSALNKAKDVFKATMHDDFSAFASGLTVTVSSAANAIRDVFQHPEKLLGDIGSLGLYVGEQLLDGFDHYMNSIGGLKMKKVILEGLGHAGVYDVPVVGGLLKSLTIGPLMDDLNKQISDAERLLNAQFIKVQPAPILSQSPANVARQAGGPLEPRRPYLVGERGPELRVFDSPGQILPNQHPATQAALASSGHTFNTVINQAPAMDPAALSRELMWQMRTAS